MVRENPRVRKWPSVGQIFKKSLAYYKCTGERYFTGSPISSLTVSLTRMSYLLWYSTKVRNICLIRNKGTYIGDIFGVVTKAIVTMGVRIVGSDTVPTYHSLNATLVFSGISASSAMSVYIYGSECKREWIRVVCNLHMMSTFHSSYPCLKLRFEERLGVRRFTYIFNHTYGYIPPKFSECEHQGKYPWDMKSISSQTLGRYGIIEIHNFLLEGYFFKLIPTKDLSI